MSSQEVRKRIFILEDDPARISLFREACLKHDLTLAVDCDDAKRAWQPPYDVVCLDHDLGGEQFVPSGRDNTGFQFTRFLTEPQPFKSCQYAQFIIHSFNPDGAEAMYKQMKDHYVVYKIPFGPTVLKHLEHL